MTMSRPAPPGAAQPPAGFAPFEFADGYIGLSGPFFWKREGEGFVYGFHSDRRHQNPNGVLHGAAVLTFLDTCLGHAIVATTGRKCATVALNAQFVAGAPAGGWVSASVRFRRTTRTMAFLDCEASSGDTLLVTATAIFRVFEAG